MSVDQSVDSKNSVPFKTFAIGIVFLLIPYFLFAASIASTKFKKIGVSQKFENLHKKSKKILKASGWTLNRKDGYRYKDGKKLSLSFMTTAGDKLRVGSNLSTTPMKRVGIEVTIKNGRQEFILETIRKANFQGWR